jgi:hypothetical protein
MRSEVFNSVYSKAVDTGKIQLLAGRHDAGGRKVRIDVFDDGETCCDVELGRQGPERACGASLRFADLDGVSHRDVSFLGAMMGRLREFSNDALKRGVVRGIASGGRMHRDDLFEQR